MKALTRRCLIFLILIQQAAYVKAVVVPCRQYTVKDGLIHSRVYRVLQDEKGFLWCTTDYGLSRFDGQTFYNYPSEKEFSGATLALGVSSGGTIWFSTSLGGLYYVRNNRIAEFAKPNALLPGKITHIRTDGLDRVWIVNESGMAGYIEQFSFKRFEKLKTRASKIYFVLPVRENVFFATDSGIYVLESGDRLKRHSSFTGAVYTLDSDTGGNILFGTSGSLFRVKKSEKVGLIAKLPVDNPVNLIRQDRSGKIWCTSTSPGLFRIENGKVENFLPALGIDQTFVNDILCDPAGNTFLATYGMGLYTVGPLNLVKFTVRDGLVNNTVSIVSEDERGNIYAGSFGGISIFEKGRFRPWNNGRLSGDEVVNDILFHQGDIWLASPLAVYRFHNGSVTRRQPGGLDLFSDGNKLLRGDYIGLQSSPYSANSFTPEKGFGNLNGTRVNRILKDKAGRYWFATRDGVFCRLADGKFKTFLSSYIVSDICEHDGSIWAATTQGLWRLKNNTWQFQPLGDGSATYSVAALASAGDGTLWIGTQRGLLYHDRGKIHFFKGSIDLMTEDISCIYEDRDNNFWIATETGLFRLSLHGSRPTGNVPSVMITGLGAEHSGKATEHGALILPYSNNRAQISFLAIDYAVPEDIEYEYSLAEAGTSPAWTRTSNHSVEFLSLAPGRYTFMVRASRVNSSLISPVKKVSIIVRKPLWQKAWFIVITGALLGGGILFITLRRIRIIQQRERQRSQRYSRLLQLKQQAIQSLISPHFVFNALSSVQHFINKSDKLSANRYISRFASLIRKTMDDSSRFTIRLRDEIERLELYLSLEKLRLGDKLTYEILVDENLAPADILIPSMLIQPFVENAIWHGIMPKDGCGHVTVSFYLKETRLHVVVEDNGVGIESGSSLLQNPTPAARGLDITAKRIKLLGKITQSPLQASITPLRHGNKTTGTRVELELPLDMRYDRMRMNAEI